MKRPILEMFWCRSCKERIPVYVDEAHLMWVPNVVLCCPECGATTSLSDAEDEKQRKLTGASR